MKRQDEGVNAAFRVSLSLCTTPERLLWWFTQYVEFNRVFAGGVAALAGEIARMDDMFNGYETEIAANVFFAAIDEFRGPKGNVATHRSLALKFLQAVAGHLGLDIHNFQIAECTKRATQAVREGYYVHGDAVLEAMGFHIGNEVLGDREYNDLDTFLQESYPELVEALEQTKAYLWVTVHCEVETEHLETARKAVELASDVVGAVRTSIAVERGFAKFKQVQDNFMNELLTELQFVQ